MNVVSRHMSIQGPVCLLEEWSKSSDNNYVVGAAFMNTDKAFHCIPHEILRSKLSAYGFDKNLKLRLITLKWSKIVCEK